MRLPRGIAWPLAVLIGTATVGASSPELPLVEAAKHSDIVALRALLQQHVDVNTAEVDGTTALHWAASRGDLDAVDLLLRHGARPRAANRYGVVPLSLACQSGNAAVVERLLKGGAAVTDTLLGGETPLMTAARSGNANVLRVLLAHGANVNARESTRGQTALMWAAAEGNVAAMRTLIEAGAEVRARSNEIDFRNYLPMVKTDAIGGVENGVRVEFSPLLFAVRAGKLDAVRLLVEAGADVNETLPDGTSTLVVAAVNARWDVGAYLLERGANPNAAGQGWTALHQIARTRTFSLGNVPHPVSTGTLSSLDLASQLIARGADVNARMTKEIKNDGYRFVMSRLGATPFLIAAKGADAPMMRLLASHGADTLIPNNTGTTPLMAAAGVDLAYLGEDTGTNEEAFEAIKVVLEFPHDLNAVNSAGMTALHGAARRGATAVVEALIAAGAKLDAKNKQGWTPLTIALGYKGGKPLFFAEQREWDAAAILYRAMTSRGVPIDEDADMLKLAVADSLQAAKP